MRMDVQDTGDKNMLQLIQLRWIAVVGQLSTIVGVNIGLGIALPMTAMLGVLTCLLVFNVVSAVRLQRHGRTTNSALFLALLVDVASLTAQLYFSGGISNPFAFLYLLQVILGAVLLAAWSTWTLVGVTTVCMATLSEVAMPLTLPRDHGVLFFTLYVQGVLICFILIAALVVVFITRINANLRSGDAQLARLRQRAAEEEHIVRMGLLASGAAHELGTPLATLAVILGDWRHLPQVRAHAELLEEVTEMETQLQRCKTIVSGILLSAGETRGESSAPTTLRRFVDDLAAKWRSSRPVAEFIYDNRITSDLEVVVDSTVAQMLCNVLDNALEASPAWLGLTVAVEHEWLILHVSDCGSGFTPAMLAHGGTPYYSSKGRAGSGLGLFLSMNVARTLGGSLSVANRAEGGAVVAMRLPLEVLRLPETLDDGR